VESNLKEIDQFTNIKGMLFSPKLICSNCSTDNQLGQQEVVRTSAQNITLPVLPEQAPLPFTAQAQTMRGGD